MKTSYNAFAIRLAILLCTIATGSLAQTAKNPCGDLLSKAIAQMSQGSYDSAQINGKNSIDCFKEASNKKGEAEALTMLGTLSEYQSDYVTSLHYFSEAVKIYEELGEKDQEIFTKRLIALYYQRNREFDKAEDFFVKQLEYYKKTNNTNEIAEYSSDLGLLYLESAKFDSAIYFLYEAFVLFEKANKKYTLGIVTNNLGDCYKFKKMYPKAISFYKKSLAICEEIKDIEGSVWPMHSLATIYTQQGNYAEAETFLQKARVITERLKIPYLQKDNYLQSSRLDSARQNFKMAYHWHKLYTTVDDSLSLAQNSKLIHEMNARFESDQKDREIQFLNTEKQSYVVLLILSGLFIISLLYLVVYKIRMEKKLNAQKLEVSEKNEELNALNDYLEDVIHEKEGLIGVVAHDLRSPLTKTEGLLNLIKITGPVNQEQESMINMIQKVCNEGNALIKDLLELSQTESNSDGPILKDQIPIRTYLDNLALQHQLRAAEKKIQIEVTSRVMEGATLHTNEEQLTRILDNLVSNAVKFSNPDTKVLLSAYSNNGHIFFSVKDEGPGIKEDEKIHLFKKFKKLSARPTAGETSTGLGLSIVKTLVEQLKGSIAVESEPGKGATFIVGVPSNN